MSEPIGIVAKIKIDKEAYKKFLKQEAKEIANELFHTFWHKSSNIYLFQYNKNESTLYIFAYYNYGNTKSLKESNIYKAIVKIESFLDEKSEGYFFAMLDSLNFEDFITQKIIEKQRFSDYQFSQDELTTIWKEVYSRFFNKIENISNYANFFDEHLSYIDKTIVNYFKTLKEEARIKVTKEELPNATPILPIQLFKGYFYNGNQFYYCDGMKEIICFENINLQNLTEINCGLTDGEHIIIDKKIIKDNPKTFKKLHLYENYYLYKSNIAIYDENLNIIDKADIKTFKAKVFKRKSVDVYYCEDINNIYYFNSIISKKALGNFTFSDGIYYDEILLIGSNQIYLGTIFLSEIDALTFKKLPLEINETYEFIKNNYSKIDSYAQDMEETIIYGKDKYGELIIFRPYTRTGEKSFVNTSYGFKNNEIIVMRKNLKEFLEFYKAYRKEISEKAQFNGTFYDITPDEDLTDYLDYYTQFNIFLESPHFEIIYTQYKYNLTFLLRVNNYLSNCWSLYTISNNELTYLKKGLEFYKKVENDYLAELNPYIFHHLACFSVALNNFDEAIIYFEKAFFYGYLEFYQMLTDENLKPIFNYKRFKELKNWYKENITETRIIKNDEWRFIPNDTSFPYFNLKIIELLEKLPENCKQGNRHQTSFIDYLHYIMKNFFIWDRIENPDTDDKKYNELLEKFIPYFNHYLQKTIDLSWQENSAYNFYKNYKIVNAKSDLIRLEYIFYQTHNEYGLKEMNKIEINELIYKIESKYQQASEEDRKYIEHSKVLKLLKNNF